MNDNEVFAKMDTDLGTDYKWNPGPTADGERFILNPNQKSLIELTQQLSLLAIGTDRD